MWLFSNGVDYELIDKKSIQFKEDFIRAVLGSEQNWAENTEFPNTVPLIHWCGTFVKISEAALTHHYHSWPVVYNRIHSWCMICGLRQMYNDTYPPL